MWTDLIVTPELIQFGGFCFAAGCAVTTVIGVVSIALRVRRRKQQDAMQRRLTLLTQTRDTHQRPWSRLDDARALAQLRGMQAVPTWPSRPRGFDAQKPFQTGAK